MMLNLYDYLKVPQNQYCMYIKFAGLHLSQESLLLYKLHP